MSCPSKLPPCQEEAIPSTGVPRGALDPPLLHRVPRADVDDVVAAETKNPKRGGEGKVDISRSENSIGNHR